MDHVVTNNLVTEGDYYSVNQDDEYINVDVYKEFSGIYAGHLSSPIGIDEDFGLVEEYEFKFLAIVDNDPITITYATNSPYFYEQIISKLRISYKYRFTSEKLKLKNGDLVYMPTIERKNCGLS